MKVFIACLLIAAVSARVVIETRTGAAKEWVDMGPAEASTTIPLKFAVREAVSVHDLEAMLMAVSDPASPTYGKHYSLAELKEVLANPAATAAVHDFLSHYDVHDTRTTPNGDYVTVKVTVATAEAMLDTKFRMFKHTTQDVTVHRCDSYSLPEEVAAAVDFVGHTINLAPLPAKALVHALSPALRGADANGEATPSVISTYYGITGKVAKGTNSVFETIRQYYDPKDISSFDSKFDVPPQKIAKVIGTNVPSACASNPNNCVEAELDVEVITSIAQTAGSPITEFWSIPGDESFLQWIDTVASTSNPPLVHSISYGAPEQDMPESQVLNFDKEVMKMGLRGLSILVASGDDGVAGSAARSGSSQCGFHPSYPATAPHVTAVGATMGPESGSTEVACQSDKGGLITSGGGFSDKYGRPSWQATQVEAYLNNGPDLPPSSQFNGSSRGYPDVALMGHNYPIVDGGQTIVGSGTSASTPLFAAILTLINSARLEAGKSSIGFANPALYGFDSSVFNDITSGENNCAAGNSAPTCCQYGFTATTGWDPITGLGSVHFDALKSAFMAL